MSQTELFNAAAKLPPGERPAFLDRACGGDPELRREVESLLRAHDDPDSFLRQRPDSTVDRRPLLGFQPGQTFAGRFKLREELGHGGMGVVFVADQTEPVQRRVALKVIREGTDSARLLARFEQERQALALMDHPNIAKVFDAGIGDTGQPYFVMELIKGMPITDYCDRAKLTPRERLELFVPVCLAVQHAHQKGVIHRDLKPSNILVGLYDGKPVPKVIDFGVAKATGQRLSEASVYTEVGSVIGTLEYMSPEQAELNNVDIDTRSDVYALGVILYQLLTGTVPFNRQELQAGGFAEMLRVIKEKEPPRPSTRLSTSRELPLVAELRRTEPSKLSQLVRGELDWIVMRSLEKDRNRRYETATGFAADVQRYLAGEPVQAVPPSPGYRVKKFVRKHKGPVLTASVASLALLAAVVVSVTFGVKATTAEGRAREEAGKATEARTEAEERSKELRRLNYVADMNLARLAWDENNLPRYQELLDRHRGDADLRGFEWDYLARLPHRDVLTLDAHAGRATAVAWLPDGRRLVSFGMREAEGVARMSDSTPGEIKLWDTATGRRMPLALAGPTDGVSAGDVSADGKRIAAACQDKCVRVWNLADGELVAEFRGHRGGKVAAVAFSPDGRLLASRATMSAREVDTADTGDLKVWSLDTKGVVFEQDKLSNVGRGLAFSPDGKRLAFRAAGGAVVVRDLGAGRQTFATAQKNEGDVMAFSPDGTRLAVSGLTTDVLVFDLATGEKVRSLAASRFPSALRYSPDGKRLAAGGAAGVNVWDADTGRPLAALKGHVGSVYALAFTPDSARLATCGRDGRVKVWDGVAGTGGVSLSDGTDPDQQPAIAVAPDGRTAVTLAKTFRLWSADGRPLAPPGRLEGTIFHSDFTADGRRLMLADARTAVLIDVADGREEFRFERTTEAGYVPTVLSPDGKWLACAAPNGIRVWDLGTRQVVGVIPTAAEVPACAFSPDSSRLVAGDKGGVVKLWDRSTLREVQAVRTEFNVVLSLRFSPDGRQLAVYGAEGVALPTTGLGIRVLEADTLRATPTPLLRVNPGRMTFSRDGRRLATGSPDGTVRLWDLATGQEVLTLRGHTQLVTSLAFTPDGHKLITASMDRTVRTWDATPLPEAKK